MGVLSKIFGRVCLMVLLNLKLLRRKLHDLPNPFPDHLKRPLIKFSNPMTFRPGLFSRLSR